MKVKPQTILPTQDFLKPGTVAYIFNCIKSNHPEHLPPAPIVKKNEDGNLLAIDGHNLIAVKHYLKEDIDIHIASSRDEGIEVKDQKDEDRNTDLRAKFDQVDALREQTIKSGINTFDDLIFKHKDLFENET